MRRILADRVVLADQLDIKPVGDQHVLKIPEPSSSNFGPTGFYGVAERVRSRQSMTVEVERAGDYVNILPEDGATFSLLPNFLERQDDTEIMDVYNKMGAEWANLPVYSSVLMDYDNTTPIVSLKMIKLKKWKNEDPTFGGVGMMVSVEHSGTDVNVRIWILTAYQDHLGLPGVPSYEWIDQGLNADLEIADVDRIAHCDLVELDDGSIVLAITEDEFIRVFKSFDMGANWSLISTPFEAAPAERRCVIDRIGSRLVLVYGLTAAGPVESFNAIVSDDGGYTWSDASEIYSEAFVDEPRMDLTRGQDGKLYIVFQSDSEPFVSSTSNGITWTTPLKTLQNCDSGASMVQEYYGLWHMYSTRDIGAGMMVIHSDARDYENPENDDWSGINDQFNTDSVDSDGMDVTDVCARGFLDDSFIDVAMIYHDDHGTDYYNVVVLRTSMWTGIQMYPLADYWPVQWYPNCYPSTVDADPNLDVWSKTVVGGGASALGGVGEGLEITANLGIGPDECFYYRNITGIESWANGIVMQFEMRVVGGNPAIRSRLISSANNKEVDFSVIFGSAKIVLWDDGAALGFERDSITPVNWDPTEWNQYLVVAKENEVQVYRAPSGVYREIAPYELILSSDTIQENAYGGDLDYIAWGVPDYNGLTNDYRTASDGDWRSMMTKEDGEPGLMDWDFNVNLRSRKCHNNPVGIMQGFGCKWDGEFAREDDNWDFQTGAHYEPENIFVSSPRIRWQEPIEDSPPSAAQIFEWERGEDLNSNDMNYNFNAFSVFGRNWMECKLEGGNAGGGGWATLFDSGATEKAYMSTHAISAIDQNGVTFVPSPYENMIPEQFASDEFRKYYIRFTDGILADRVYRILSNNATQLFMEEDIETVGAGVADNFVIFTDRFFYEFASMQTYERLRLTIAASRTSPTEAQLRLGTLIIGKTYLLKDDMWESSIRTVPNVMIQAGRSGVQSVDEMGQEQRIVNVKYTGHIDRGMGITDPSQLWRFLRQSVHPLVWVDDDSGLDTDTDYVFHEPILVRRMGEASQNRLSYVAEIQRFVSDDVTWRRSMMEQAIKLEEVL